MYSYNEKAIDITVSSWKVIAAKHENPLYNANSVKVVINWCFNQKNEGCKTPNKSTYPSQNTKQINLPITKHQTNQPTYRKATNKSTHHHICCICRRDRHCRPGMISYFHKPLSNDGPHLHWHRTEQAKTWRWTAMS